jgi:hypothetical protein
MGKSKTPLVQFVINVNVTEVMLVLTLLTANSM